jgi:hypothetical protein
MRNGDTGVASVRNNVSRNDDCGIRVLCGSCESSGVVIRVERGDSDDCGIVCLCEPSGLMVVLMGPCDDTGRLW